MLHELGLDQRVLHGHFSKDLEPAIEIDPGDSVRFTAPNHAWDIARDEQFAPRSPELDIEGHALAGPILVRGAKAGQTLVVKIDSVEPAPWGVVHGGRDHAIHWELRDGIGRADGFEIELAPFLGVMGMPPPEPGVHSTGPPRRWGGNMDCKELVAGTTLYLPIPVDGALFSAGDGHAVQGDGEVSGTAIEAPTTAQVTLDVADEPKLEWPLARIDGAWITLGFAEELEEAGRRALGGMLALMEREVGVSGADAMALASLGVDLRVTQVVNGCVGVHAVLRDGAFG
jgi:acetamidase/formamidase